MVSICFKESQAIGLKIDSEFDNIMSWREKNISLVKHS